MIDAAVLNGIRFSYDGGASWALDGVDLTVHTGQYLCLTGPNGSGKSTLARIIAGLAAPDEGRVTLLGHAVFDGGADPRQYRAARRNIGAVFQNPEDQLVTTVSEDDVAFGPENLGVPRSRIGERIDESLDSVGMDAHRYDDPTRMSGGQQQRIAIAGMLAMHPSMLVLDEPTAMLDPNGRAEVMRILDELHARGTTIVHVTHHADEAARAERVVRIDKGKVVDDVHHGGEESRTRRTETDIMPSREPSAAEGDAVQRERAERLGSNGNDAQPAIVIDHVTYRYPGADAPAIDDLSMTVDGGETVAIMGANGAGKSTLARLICALERPSAGSITVAGIPVAADRGAATGRSRRQPRTPNHSQRKALRRTVGFVMQHPERQLFAETVAEDVAYGPRNQRLDDAEVSARVDEALRMLHIEHLADRSPFSLSGGQQRLVAIAGVIACRPRILVMDEPTASLDSASTARIHELIRSLHSQGTTVLLVTHSAQEAQAVADRIVTIGTAADGRDAPARDAHAPRVEKAAPLRNGNAISRLDPRVKMVTFLMMMFTAFAIGTPAQLAAGALMVGAIVAASRLGPLRLLASVHMFLAMFVAMGALNVFFVRTGDVLVRLGPIPITDDGVSVAALYALRFALVIILGAVLMFTTTPTELTDGFGSLLSPLRRVGLHTQEIALVMSLALRFLPTLGAEAKAIADAQAARGGSIETGSPSARLKAMTALCIPMFAGAIRHADNLSLALDARCYEEGIRRTRWHELRLRASDIAFCVVTIAYVIALVAVI